MENNSCAGKIIKKKKNFLLKKRACCAIFICGKAIY